MAKISQAKRLIKEDFSSKDYQLIEKLGYVINPIVEQLVLSFNKNITFQENLNSEIKTIDIEVDEIGIPIIPVQFSSGLGNKLQGILVIRSFLMDTKADDVFTINSIANVGGIVTITTTSSHNFNTGDRVVLEGTDSTPNIDGTYIITAISPTKFQISSSITVAGSLGSASKYLNIYPKGYPFITFSENTNIVTINQITGLPNNKKFKLVLLTIGSLT